MSKANYFKIIEYNCKMCKKTHKERDALFYEHYESNFPAPKFRQIVESAKRNWRPDNWENPYIKYPPESSAFSDHSAKAFEAGAGAMHIADVEFLSKHLIERPATGKVRIIMDIEDWGIFKGKQDD